MPENDRPLAAVPAPADPNLEALGVLTTSAVDALKQQAQSNERVEMHEITEETKRCNLKEENNHKQLMYDKKSNDVKFAVAVFSILVMGGVGAYFTFTAGKTEAGTNIVVSCASLIVGLLGGKGLSK